jgi:hypothetical protein
MEFYALPYLEAVRGGRELLPRFGYLGNNIRTVAAELNQSIEDMVRYRDRRGLPSHMGIEGRYIRALPPDNRILVNGGLRSGSVAATAAGGTAASAAAALALASGEKRCHKQRRGENP